MTHDTIAVSAYHLWEAEGRPHGRHDAHWLEAEAALLCAAAPAAVQNAPIEVAPAVKAPAARKTAVRKAAAAKVKAPSAPAETVVAASALNKTTRSGRAATKTVSRTH